MGANEQHLPLLPAPIAALRSVAHSVDRRRPIVGGKESTDALSAGEPPDFQTESLKPESHKLFLLGLA